MKFSAEVLPKIFVSQCRFLDKIGWIFMLGSSDEKKFNNNITTQPVLTKHEINYLFKGILRIPDFFAQARRHIKLEYFDSDYELFYIILWKKFLSLESERGAAFLFDPSNIDKVCDILQTEVFAALEGIAPDRKKQIINNFFNENNFLVWVYSSPPESIDRLKLDEYLKRFFIHRGVQDPLKKLFSVTGRQTIVDISTLLRGCVEELNEINFNNLSSVVSSPSVNFIESFKTKKFPTGIKFLDFMLDGGQIDGEVYGVLGAYGGGKTLFAVQLACDSIRYQIEENYLAENYSLEKKPIRHSFIFHYEASTNEMQKRTIANLCEISLRSLDEGVEKFSSKFGPIKIKSYEKKYWSKAIEFSEDEFLPEFERLQRLSLYSPYIHLVDCSGTNPNASAKVGSGYVEEIAEILESLKKKHNYDIGVVIIDYAGLCCRRYINANPGFRLEHLRHLIGNFGDKCRHLIAGPFNCPVWVFHQLAAAANKRTHAVQAHHADAAESKSFVENMSYAFNMGVPHEKYRTLLFSVTKARRSALSPPEFLLINGEFQRLEPAKDKFDYNYQTGEVCPIEDVSDLSSSFDYSNSFDSTDFSSDGDSSLEL